jgi:hypothetical protein
MRFAHIPHRASLGPGDVTATGIGSRHHSPAWARWRGHPKVCDNQPAVIPTDAVAGLPTPFGKLTLPRLKPGGSGLRQLPWPVSRHYYDRP